MCDEPVYGIHEDNYYYKDIPINKPQRVELDWDNINPNTKNAINYWYSHDMSLRRVGELFDVSLATLEDMTNYLRNSDRFPDFVAKHPRLNYIKDVNLFKLIVLRHLNGVNITNIGKFCDIKRWTVESILKRYGFYVKDQDINSLDDIAVSIINKDNDIFNDIVYNLNLFANKYTCEYGSPRDLLLLISSLKSDNLS